MLSIYCLQSPGNIFGDKRFVQMEQEKEAQNVMSATSQPMKFGPQVQWATRSGAQYTVQKSWRAFLEEMVFWSTLRSQ